MQFEAPTIYFCPSCDKPMLKQNYISYTVFNSDVYSDGYNTGYPYFTPDLGKCPNCAVKFFLHNLWAKKDNADYEEYKYYKYIDKPDLDDYIKVLEQGLPKNRYEEIEARMCLWRTFNDKVRFNFRVESDEWICFTDKEMKLWQENCAALLQLLNSKLDELNEEKEKKAETDDSDEYGDYRTYIMEIQRNLGLFDECIKTIESLPAKYDWLKDQFIAKCEAKDRMTFKLKKDDDDDEIYEDDNNLEDSYLSEEEKIEKKIEEYNKFLEAEEDSYYGRYKHFYLFKRAEMYVKKDDLQAALADINDAIEMDDNDAAYYALRAEIYGKLGNTEKAEYDIFKAKLIDTQQFIREKDPEMYVRYKEYKEQKPLIETENHWEILQNEDKEIRLCFGTYDLEPIEPEILYSGGENALFRRNLHQFILLNNVHEGIREALHKKSEVVIAEFMYPEDQLGHRKIVREYMAKVRPVIETIESIEDIIEGGYLMYTTLRARLYANHEKPVTELIEKEDYANLAAVLAREEDYRQLERTACFWSSETLNKNVSQSFRNWRPSPLYYITLGRIWLSMLEPAKMLRWLVAHGADPDKLSGHGEGDEDADTPLNNQCVLKESSAVSEGYSFCAPEILKALLDAGADPNKKCGEITPINRLFYPDEYDDETCEFTPLTESYLTRAALLLEYGAKSDGMTLAQALAFSVGELREKLVNMLRANDVTIDAALEYMEDAADSFPLFYRTLHDLYMEGKYAAKDEERAKIYLEKFDMRSEEECYAKRLLDEVKQAAVISK